MCRHENRIKIEEHTGGTFDCIDFRCTECGALIRIWDIGEINIYQEREGTDGSSKSKRRIEDVPEAYRRDMA